MPNTNQNIQPRCGIFYLGEMLAEHIQSHIDRKNLQSAITLMGHSKYIIQRRIILHSTNYKTAQRVRNETCGQKILKLDQWYLVSPSPEREYILSRLNAIFFHPMRQATFFLIKNLHSANERVVKLKAFYRGCNPD